MSLPQSAADIAGSTKAVVVTAIPATAAGMGQTFGWIPDDIGKLASLVGMIALFAPIVFAAKRWQLEKQQMRLQIKLLEKKYSEDEEDG